MERSSRHRSRSTLSRFLPSKDAVVCRLFFIWVLFVATVHLSPINANYRHSSSNPVVCHTKECLRSAANFKQNMDLSIDPCDDFYSYACGHWADNYPPSKEKKTHDWSAVQHIKIDRMIRDQLEANISRLDPKPVAQAKEMFKACRKSREDWKNYDYEFHKVQDRYRFSVIQKYLKEFGLPTIPTLLKHEKELRENNTFDWIWSVATIQRKLGLNIMIGLNFAFDQRNMDCIRLTLGYFSRSELIELPMYVWSVLEPKDEASRTENEKSQKSDNEANTKHNQQYVDSSPEQLEETYYTWALFPTLTKEFLAFYKHLPVLEDERKEEEQTYYTVAELQNITDSHISPRKPYPVWQHYLDVLFADLPDNKPTADEKLLIKQTNVQYLCNLVDFISKQSPELIEFYIWKTVIDFFVNHPFNWKLDCTECVQQLMDLAITYTISDKNFLNETKPRLDQLFSDIRSEFNQMVRETEWIDEQTKNALVKKSNAMEARIGVPEWILNADKLKEHYHGLEVDGTHHFENWINGLQILVTKKLQLFRLHIRTIKRVELKDFNAYNAKIFNAIHISGGTLQYPFYHLGLEALNYGALGFTFGHEITHNFDDSGRFYDLYGNYEHVWSNQSLRKFEDRVSCLVQQYDSYYVPDAKGYINGTLTHNENIADNLGIQEVFRAYRAYVKQNGPEPVLPGFENFTHEQLFFISFGNQYCETISSVHGEEILNYAHSPGKFRVVGVLSNMEEFSEAFQCPRGSKMNPEKKCRVW